MVQVDKDDAHGFIWQFIKVMRLMMIDDKDYDNDDHDDSNAVAADDDEEGTAAL